MHAVLSIGSNMDDRYALLNTVIEEFKDEIVAQSAIYSTPPWGIEDQDEFLNAVLVVEVEETPIELLRRGKNSKKPPSGSASANGGHAPSMWISCRSLKMGKRSFLRIPN